jgi:hypothetical protein
VVARIGTLGTLYIYVLVLCGKMCFFSVYCRVFTLPPLWFPGPCLTKLRMIAPRERRPSREERGHRWTSQTSSGSPSGVPGIHTTHIFITLTKKKRKLSSYIMKFRGIGYEVILTIRIQDVSLQIRIRSYKNSSGSKTLFSTNVYPT